MQNKKILITGGAGFIGSNLALTLQWQFPNNEYFIIDDFLVGDFKNILGFNGEVLAEDISSMDLNKKFPNGLDIIFHQGAITDTTIKDQNKMLKINVGGFMNVLNFCLEHKARLIYASSAAVYGQTKPPMIVGNNEEPANIYGYSKLVGDNIARKHFSDISIIGLRYFNVYGPREKYKNKMASMIWQLYLQMKEGDRPRIFKNGEQKRDHIYVKDVVKANILAMNCAESGIYNIGTGRATSFNEIIEALNEAMGTNLAPEYIDNPYGKFYQDFTEADLTETKKYLGFEPEFDIKKGVKDYFLV